MPKTAIKIVLDEAQLAELRLRFPEAKTDTETVYRALDIEPPAHGGARWGARRKTMITVTNAGSLAGYSTTDHLIDDSGIKEIVGKQFSTVKKALKAADDRCFIEAAKGYRRHPYTWIEVQFADGRVEEFKSVS